MTMPDPIKPTAADREAAASAYYAWIGSNPVIPRKMTAGDADGHSMVQAFALHAQQAREQAMEEALGAQPSTAENPNEDAYQRGRFDGIMEFAKAILALKEQPPC